MRNKRLGREIGVEIRWVEGKICVCLKIPTRKTYKNLITTLI